MSEHVNNTNKLPAINVSSGRAVKLKLKWKGFALFCFPGNNFPSKFIFLNSQTEFVNEVECASPEQCVENFMGCRFEL